MELPATLAPPSLPGPEALREVSRRLAGVWAVLGRGLGIWHARERASPLPPLAHRRAGRLFARLQAILALLAEGRLPRSHPPRTHPPRPRPEPAEATGPEATGPGATEPGAIGPEATETGAAQPEAAPQDATPAKSRPPRLPRRVGWLMGRTLDINIAASNLRHWLADPAVRSVLAEIPQARAPLVGLCRMLGVPPWPLDPGGPLPPGKPRLRKPRPPRPKRETLRELRASFRTYRNIEIDDGLVPPGRDPWWLPPLRYRRR